MQQARKPEGGHKGHHPKAKNHHAGSGKAKSEHDSVPPVSYFSLYRYATGRDWQKGEREWQGWLHAAFARDGYRLPDLLRRIALSDAFYRVAPPAPPPALPATEARS